MSCSLFCQKSVGYLIDHQAAEANAEWGTDQVAMW